MFGFYLLIYLMLISKVVDPMLHMREENKRNTFFYLTEEFHMGTNKMVYVN